MKKFLIYLIALLLCSINMIAQQRSESEAIQIAQEFFGKKGLTPILSVVSPQRVGTQIRKKIGSARKAQAKGAGFFVVNDEANKRFVIVSSDERMYKILGYSNNGVFCEEEIPCGLLVLLDSYNMLYDSLRVSNADLPRKETRKTGFRKIGPLIKSKWGQRTPFNDQCPYDINKSETSRCLSGCVATAMAQVMNYYQHPTKCQGTYSYNTPLGLNLQLDYNSVAFNWNKVQDTYTYYVDSEGHYNYEDGRTAEEKAEVAKLMYACGVSVSMEYGIGGSSASSFNIPYALINYFNYNPNVVFKDSWYYSDDEWDEMILRDLEAGHPILYTGANNFWDGHEFVLDGCDEEGRYSFNFGWNGSSDGFYYLKGTNSINYNWKQQMVCQVTPEEWGTHEDVFYATSFSSNKTSAKIGEKAKFSFYAFCYSSSATIDEPNTGSYSGEIGIGLYDTDFNFVKPLYQKHVTDFNILNSEHIYEDITFDLSTFQNGKSYFIAPYAKRDGENQPTRIRTSHGDQDFYQAIVEGNVVKLWLKGIEFNEVLTGAYRATALNKDGDLESWEVMLSKSSYSDLSYTISNFDPAVNRLQNHDSYISNNVTGDINADGTQLSISVYSLLGKNIRISNLSGEGDIIVHLDAKNKTMYIDDIWGVKVTTESGDNATVEEISRYTNTKYVYKDNPTPDAKVESPLIEITSQNIVTLISRTPGSIIHYTLDGTIPTANSTKYVAPFHLTENCTVKVIAVKDGNNSEIAERAVMSFVVEKPVISGEAGKVKMTCATPGSIIYYTTDESIPTKGSDKYTGEIPCSVTTVFSAIAIKSNYVDSPVELYVFVPKPNQDPIPDPTPDDNSMVIEDNVAGQLSSHFNEQAKLTVISLEISGNLNGTDFKFISELCRNGRLANLNLRNSRIVEGGAPYFNGSFSNYYTENDKITTFLFYDANSLVNLQLPASSKLMDVSAITACENLKELTIPEGCEIVRMGAIRDCKNLESVTLSKGVKDFAPDNFSSCPNLKYIGVESGNTTYKSVDGVLYSYDGGSIVRYPEGAVVETYIVPPSVHTISENAFGHSSIKVFELPNSLKRIESMAFSFCKQLENIVIPNSVEYLGALAFSYCSNLLSVTLSSHIANIGMKTFSDCVNLTELMVGANVEKISGDAFDGCKSLQRFVVDPSNQWYCSLNGVLYTKDMKQVVRCPESLYATEFLIPESVEVIGESAFYGCKNIDVFHFPNTVKTIGDFSFANCTMKSVSLHKQVESIGSAAFMYCMNLEAFAIPIGMKEIKMSLFNNCQNLTYVYIPEDIQSIGYSAFRDCKSLTMINCRIKEIENVEIDYLSSFGYTPFVNISDTCTWRVPAGGAKGTIDYDKYANLYKAQPWWVPTWNIIIDDSTVGIDDTIAYDYGLSWNSGKLFITPNSNGTINIYSVNGSLVKSINGKSGKHYQIEIPRGMYIINNKKVILK